MNVNILEKLNELYSLKHIIRYNNIPRIKDESVAEHSFFVALLTAELNKTYNFNLERALLIAVTHDIFEIYVSDIPRNVKNKFKKLDKIMAWVENAVATEKFPEYKQLIDEFNKQKTVEALIVKLADNLSVLQYVNTEISLGSAFYMPKVRDTANNEIKILEKKLEKFKK